MTHENGGRATARARAARAALVAAFALFRLYAASAADAASAVCFERVFPSFETEAEAKAALAADPEGRETALRAGNFYFILGTAATTRPDARLPSAKKAVEILERLWKKDRKDDEVCLSLGYAYTAAAGATPMSQLESLLASINKAQNLFGSIVARLPANIDARLARTMINMNLTAQNGRPDALVLEDAAVFFAGYGRLPPESAAHPYYLMGLMEMRLAKALVLHDQGKKKEARELVREIDGGILPEQFRKLLEPLAKAYGR